MNKRGLGLLEGNGNYQERLGSGAGVCLASAGIRRPLSCCSSLVIIKVRNAIALENGIRNFPSILRMVTLSPAGMNLSLTARFK